MGDRRDRIARNEAIFREVNERVREVSKRASRADERVEFLCECGHENCTESLVLTPAEYEDVRSEAAQFALLPGHEAPDVESVVATVEDRFVIARKHEDEATIARETDPRS
jgi:hypothetical protein